MGKKGSSSWLNAVKRAFRSPTKDSDKKSGRRREDCDQEEDEEKVLQKFKIMLIFPFFYDPFNFYLFILYGSFNSFLILYDPFNFVTKKETFY